MSQSFVKEEKGKMFLLQSEFYCENSDSNYGIKLLNEITIAIITTKC